MKIGYSSLVDLSKDYGLRTVVLSPFSFALCLSIVGSAPEIFYWREMDESERIEAVDLLAKAESELMSNPTLGWVVPISGSVPDNMLECDGSVHLRVDYLELWEVLDVAFKVDSDTFRLPNLSRRTVFGGGGDWHTGDIGGEESHALSVDEIPQHSHTYTSPIVGDLDFEEVGIPQPATAINPIPQNTSVVGGGQHHNNMPPYQILRWAMVVR